MNYELFLQGPSVYVPVILISLAFTLVGYAIFPISFAKLRKSPIRDRKYDLICYGVNLLIKGVFAATGAGGSFSPYFLWTWIFTSKGKSMLRKKGLLINKMTAHYFSENKQIDPAVDELSDDISKDELPSQMVNDIPAAAVTAGADFESAAMKKPQIKFCRKCGFKLVEDSRFCSKCGTEVVRG